MTRRIHSRDAFTLIEMLTVMTVLVILLSLSMYALQKVRATASLTQCGNNLRQIGMAILAFEDKNARFPHGRLGCDGATTPTPCANQSPSQRTGLSGFAMILPFLGETAVYENLDLADPPWSFTSTWQSANKTAIETSIAVYRCPMDPSQRHLSGSLKSATGSYALVHGSIGPSQGIDPNMKVLNNGPFVYRLFHTRDTILDGLSNTFFVGEVVGADDTSRSVNLWACAGRHETSLRSTENPLNTRPGTGITTSPYGIPLSGAFGSYHPNGGNFLYGDGHVVFVADNVAHGVYKGLSTRSGGETALYP